MMIPVQSADEIRKERKAVKDAYGAVVTNFTTLPKEYGDWIEEGSLYHLGCGRASYFIHETARGNEVFFFADSYESVRSSLAELQQCLKKDSVMEIVQRDSVPLFGSTMMVLQRMVSTVIPEVNPETFTETDKCTQDELKDIEDILLASFNPLAERIPTVGQLEWLSANPQDGGIFVIRDYDRITGLMVYAIDRSTIHLRYWWTDSAYRNQGIGSMLLNRFFHLGASCQRMILWVRTDNEEAIKRYVHYGFVPEQMYDYIYKVK